jgi:PAS domain-containing protein
MGTEQLDREISLLWQRVGRIRAATARSDSSSDLTSEALAELSNALEELRVSSDELNRQNEELRVTHLERERESRRYQDLFQSAPAGYVVTDVVGTVTEVNEAAQRLFGARASSIVGKSLAARVVHSDLPKLTTLLKPGASSAAGTELHLRSRAIGPSLRTWSGRSSMTRKAPSSGTAGRSTTRP